MENMKRLQDLALKIILFLVWFDLMCFALILAGNIFKWSFFNDSIGGTFFTAFGLSLGALVALAILHLVLTLNMISNSISHIARDKIEIDPKSKILNKKRFEYLILGSLLGILLIVAYQGIAEQNAARHKVQKVEKHLKDVGESTLPSRIIDLVEANDEIKKLYAVRDEMLYSLEEDVRGVTLLIPKKGEESILFYKITPWDYGKTDNALIADQLDRIFVPREKERKNFIAMKKSFKPFSVVDRRYIRSYYPVAEDGKIKLILLLDTSRTVSNEYLKSRQSGW